jgi:hypothetical protein
MRSISAASRRHVIIAWCCKGQGRRPRAAGLTRVHGRRRPSLKPMAVRQIGSKCHHTGPHAHATDAFGTPLEFCASMPEMPRMITRFTHATPTALALRHPRSARLRLLRGGGLPPERIHCPQRGAFAPRSVPLQRKGNPHDIDHAALPGDREDSGSDSVGEYGSAAIGRGGVLISHVPSPTRMKGAQIAGCA